MSSADPIVTSGASPVPSADSQYWTFYAAVAQAQLAAWLPEAPARVLDLSGRSGFAGQLVAAGHEVLHVGEHPPLADGPGRLLRVAAERRSLGWLAQDSVDLVLAESTVLSTCLATEIVLEHLARVLRPGGRLLLVVESLVLGLARLADQGRWAELADVPSADVVLVPDDDGTITRCFWPDALRALLADVGLELEWVRPRSVLTPATVERALLEGGAPALRTLVQSELVLAVGRQGDSTGLHLVASARQTRGVPGGQVPAGTRPGPG